jgi:hypothetical protein
MKKIIIYTLGLFLLTLIVSSCGKDFLEINQNPNEATASTPELVLTNALSVAAGGANSPTIATSSFINRNELGSYWAGHWAPSGTYSGFVGERQYVVLNTFRTGIWNGLYDNLKDFDYVQQESAKQSKTAFVGICKVMKAFNFQALVDTYGNVPYSEALKAPAVIRPKYDDAQGIYDSLIVILNSAIADLKAPYKGDNINPGGNDLYFQGDQTSWIKFANTLKLRILIRQSGVSVRQDLIKAEIAKIKTEGSGYLTDDVLVNPGYIKSEGKQNPFWEFYGFQPSGSESSTKKAYAISNTLIDYLDNSLDPRIEEIAAPRDADKTFVGMPLGPPNNQTIYALVSGLGPALLNKFDQPSILMTAAESYFLQAEAIQRGYTTGSVRDAYEEGVRKSFEQTGLTVADADDYLTNSTNTTVNYDLATDKLELILTQKWVALAGAFQGFEAWCDFRRTNIPSIPLSLNASVAKQPIRLLYPDTEVATNNTNVLSQNVNEIFDTKIFWDKN